MPGSTTVTGIVITGQRRRTINDAFPLLPEIAEIGTEGHSTDEGGSGAGSLGHPCNNPAFKKKWDTDAKAAEAVAAFLEEAALLGGSDLDSSGGPTLDNREFYAALLLGGDGQPHLGPVVYGDPVSGGVTPSVQPSTFQSFNVSRRRSFSP